MLNTNNHLRWRQIALPVLLGLALRVMLFSFVVEYRFDQGDAVMYDQLAMNLADRSTFSLATSEPFLPTTIRAPGYPTFLSIIYLLVGRWVLAVQLAQSLLFLFAVAFLANAIARVSPRLGLVALWAAALSPSDALYSGAILSEALCASLLLIALALPHHRCEKHKALTWVFSGVFLGAAALCRDVYLLLLPVIAIAVTLGAGPSEGGSLRNRAQSAILLLAGSCVVVGGWSARNYAVSGRVIPISEGLLGMNLWSGTWLTSGNWGIITDVESRLPAVATRGGKDESEIRHAFELVQVDVSQADAIFMRVARDRMRTEPLSVARCWIVRSPRMWIGTRSDLFAFRGEWLQRGAPLWVLMKSALLGLNVAILALASAGFLLCIRNRSRLLWYAIPILYTAVIYVPLYNIETRYSQPVYSLVLIFAAVFTLRALPGESATRVGY